MSILHNIMSVTRDVDPGVLIVRVDVTDDYGVREILPYAYREDDPYGLSPDVKQWLADHEGEYTLEPYIPPAPQPVVYQIAKTTPWLRMTDDEAATMDAVMSETTARVKQIYMAATYLASDDPLWQTLWQILSDAFGAARANQLLAPET